MIAAPWRSRWWDSVASDSVACDGIHVATYSIRLSGMFWRLCERCRKASLVWQLFKQLSILIASLVYIPDRIIQREHSTILLYLLHSFFDCVPHLSPLIYVWFTRFFQDFIHSLLFTTQWSPLLVGTSEAMSYTLRGVWNPYISVFWENTCVLVCISVFVCLTFCLF